MALNPCPECGHQISDRAAACPDCGAPLGVARSIVSQPSIEEWAISKLKAGSPRRSVVGEIVKERGMPGSEADVLVKRLESALVPERPTHLVKIAAGIGLATSVLLIVFVLMRLIV